MLIETNLTYAERKYLKNLKKSITANAVMVEKMEKYRNFVNFHSKSKNKNSILARSK